LFILLKITMAPESHLVVLDNPEAVEIEKVDKADENVSTTLNGDMAAVDSIDPAKVAKLAADMQQRCRLFLDELEQFQAYLKDQKKERQVELRTFKASLQSEMRAIDRVSIGYPPPEYVSLLILHNS
jgi:hypothetical protein